MIRIRALAVLFLFSLFPQVLFADGALTSLASCLGPERELSFVSWEPIDFQKAVQAGFTTVWIGTGSLLRRPPEEQRAILQQASRAGLRTLGFIGGDPEWVNPDRPHIREKVAGEYDRLTKVLETFLAQDAGNLRFAFATDIEPHVRNWWDGNLTAYSDLLEQVVIPTIEPFARKHPDRVRDPFLTRFEPFWWDNGRRTDSGKFIYGLRDFPSDVASMTYRNTAEQLDEVSRSIRRRVQRTQEMGFLLGVETKPPGPGIPPHITFYGRLRELPGELVHIIQRMSQQDRDHLRGVFIHSGRTEAEQLLNNLL
ncbi:MAG: hypothetical protein HY211_07375 [Candidatus Omnitrophica bacterium]|nr:hypothetical protein [Candidatus Omnitrophota bacterium]